MASTRPLLILVFIFFCFYYSNAQPSIQWQKSLGGTLIDQANSIQQTMDGGYIVAGHTQSNDSDVTGNHGNSEYWVVKLDSMGTIQWQKCLGGSMGEEANSIQQTTDSGYIIAGSSSSNDGDVTNNNSINNVDFWVVKLSSMGTIQWQKCMGGSRSDVAYSIQQTMDGGYAVAGSSGSNDSDVTGNHGMQDYWVVKLDTNGTIQWQKSMGGSGGDAAFSICQTMDSGYIVAGMSNSIDGDVIGNINFGNNYWVVKLNSMGTIQWQKILGNGSARANSIQQTTDSGYIVAGTALGNGYDVSGNRGVYDFWVVKLNSTGTIRWQKCMGGSDQEWANSIRQTTDGGYVVAGFAESNDSDLTSNNGGMDYWVVKLNSNASIEWQQNLGGSLDDYATSIWQTSDTGYIVAGRSKSNDFDVTGNNGNWDYWIVKLGWTITGIPEIINPVSDFKVNPNPVSRSAEISFSLNQSEHISVAVYDIAGRIVRILFDDKLAPGNHQLQWNLKEGQVVADGIYFLKIISAGFTKSCRLVVVE